MSHACVMLINSHFTFRHRVQNHHLYSLLTTHDDLDSADFSSMQDACHICTQLNGLALIRTSLQFVLVIKAAPQISWSMNHCYQQLRAVHDKHKNKTSYVPLVVGFGKVVTVVCIDFAEIKKKK